LVIFVKLTITNCNHYQLQNKLHTFDKIQHGSIATHRMPKKLTQQTLPRFPIITLTGRSNSS